MVRVAVVGSILVFLDYPLQPYIKGVRRETAKYVMKPGFRVTEQIADAFTAEYGRRKGKEMGIRRTGGTRGDTAT